VAAVGLDAHDRAAARFARALRDAGLEVIDAGPCPGAGPIASTVVQEDADAVGVVVSGTRLEVFPALLEELAGQGFADVVVVGCGALSEAELDTLRRSGVAVSSSIEPDPTPTVRQLVAALDVRDAAPAE
jgi:methylmalonyl-CoA mutase, C-terminal domain